MLRRLHTRAVVMGRSNECPFWNAISDFGIEFQPDHAQAREHPQVKAVLEAMQRKFPVTHVEFRDCC